MQTWKRAVDNAPLIPSLLEGPENHSGDVERQTANGWADKTAGAE